MVNLLGALLDSILQLLHDWWPQLLIVLAMAFLRPVWSAFEHVGAATDAVARRQGLAASLIVAVALICALASVLIRGSLPLPVLQDDHACYLGGQMFAEGYAAYPTHPLWPHFESMHVLQVPAYASKYPLGNEVLLALGIRLTGVAIAGPWVAAGVACSAIFWALLGALPPAWALAGALAAALHPLMVSWSQSYRGGGLAALGGALLFGATVRIARAPNARLGAIAGAGLGLLAVSRPYEGMILAIGCALGLLAHARIGLAGRIRKMAMCTVGCAGVVAVALVAVALHNHAVTGSYTTLPWVAYARQYDPAPQFVWQSPKPMPQYRNEEFRHEYAQYRWRFDKVKAPGGLFKDMTLKVYLMQWMLTSDPEARRGLSLHWPLFLVPFLFLPVLFWRDALARLASIVVIVFAFAPISMYVSLLTHYLAPVAAAVAMLMMMLIRSMCARPATRGIALAIGVTFVIHAMTELAATRPGSVPLRDRVMELAGPGRHLIVVAPNVYDVVYNDPDIDAAQVVWARDLGDNRALRAYYRDRAQWRLEGGAQKYVLRRLTPLDPPTDRQ